MQVQFWPQSDQPHVIHLNDSSVSATAQELHLSALRLQNGATYKVEVFAINGAKMTAAEESQGVTIDTTPPVVPKVILFSDMFLSVFVTIVILLSEICFVGVF